MICSFLRFFQKKFSENLNLVCFSSLEIFNPVIATFRVFLGVANIAIKYDSMFF